MIYVFIGAALVLAGLIGVYWVKRGDRSSTPRPGPRGGGGGGGSQDEDPKSDRTVE
jgi:hypothetical protein